MNSPLSKLCLALWALGLLAMLTLKGAMDYGPGTDAFCTAQGIWITGGLGYALLGLLGICFEHQESMKQAGGSESAHPTGAGERI